MQILQLQQEATLTTAPTQLNNAVPINTDVDSIYVAANAIGDIKPYVNTVANKIFISASTNTDADITAADIYSVLTEINVTTLTLNKTLHTLVLSLDVLCAKLGTVLRLQRETKVIR